MTITIRRAGPGDEGTLSGLNQFVHEIHVANRGQHFKPHDAREVADLFRKRLQNPTVQIWIAEQGGKAVGYVSVCRVERAEDAYLFAGRWADINEIGVHPSFQRTGIGRLLVQKVIDEARAQGIEEVELTTWSFNEPALQAFQRLGFEPKWVRFGMSTSRTES
jgi:ribosomal protein S18 acetylase RimI-like enzyme